MAWFDWEKSAGVLTSSPGVSSWGPGRLDVFVRGTDSRLYHKWFENGWNDWEPLGGVLTSAPESGVVGVGSDRRLRRGASTASCTTSGSRTAGMIGRALGGILMSEPAACSWGPGRLDVILLGGRTASSITSRQRTAGVIGRAWVGS